MMRFFSFLGLALCLAAVSLAADEDHTPPRSPDKWKATFYLDAGVCNAVANNITEYIAYDGDKTVSILSFRPFTVHSVLFFHQFYISLPT